MTYMFRHTCKYMYSTVQMQGITNAHLRSRATAFVSACERVRFSSQTRSPPPTNAFVSPNERKRKRPFRWGASRLLVRACSHINYLVCFPNYVWGKGHQQFGGRISRCARPLITSYERVHLDPQTRSLYFASERYCIYQQVGYRAMSKYYMGDYVVS